MSHTGCPVSLNLTGSRKYLADGNVDVRLATENVLAEFLREIKYIADVQEKQAEADRTKREERQVRRRSSKQTMESAIVDDDEAVEEAVGQDGDVGDDATVIDAVEDHDWEGEGSGAWVPGQGVFVDHTAIMDIVIQHLAYPGSFLGSH